MIIPMLKYSMLCHHLEYKEFLNKLYELGVVHIIEKDKDEVDNYRKNKINIQLFEKSLKKIAQRRNITEAASEGPNLEINILPYIEETEEKIAELEKQKGRIEENIKFYNRWDNFDLESITKLNDIGISVKFYQAGIQKFKKEWLENYPIEIINEDKSYIYFISLSYENEEIDIPANEVELPGKSLNELKQELQEKTNEIKRLNKELDGNIAKTLYILKEQVETENRELDFRYVNANTEKLSDEKVILLEGWVPETVKDKLDDYLEKEDIVYFMEKPGKEDKIPILLKNNRFAKLFEPIGKLFSLPSYMEIDLTPFFAPFFMLFFGFCVGDAGYGLLILIATLIFRKKASAALKPILSLATYLGAATVIMGLVTGTLFGVNLIDIKPYPLKKIILEPLNLFWLSIGIGGLQIIFGMIIKAVNQIKQSGLKYALSTIGWISLILFAGLLIGLKQLNISNEIITLVLKVCLGLSGGMILIFANPDKNIIISIFSGVYNVYNVVTGVFGDLLSYIRLFAIGISSAILGLVFNQIASQFLGMGVVGWILFIIVLLIGHGLNIFLACLGAFVHPMRLTFVEFYKNAGFSGGGKEYKPFSK